MEDSEPNSRVDSGSRRPWEDRRVKSNNVTLVESSGTARMQRSQTEQLGKTVQLNRIPERQ